MDPNNENGIIINQTSKKKGWTAISEELDELIVEKASDGLSVKCKCGVTLSLPERNSFNGGLFVFKNHMQTNAHQTFIDSVTKFDKGLKQPRITTFFSSPTNAASSSDANGSKAFRKRPFETMPLQSLQHNVVSCEVPETVRKSPSSPSFPCPGLLPPSFVKKIETKNLVLLQKYGCMLADCVLETQDGKLPRLRSCACTGFRVSSPRDPRTSQGCTECYAIYVRHANFTVRLQQRMQKYEFLESVLARVACEGGVLTGSERKRCENYLHEPEESQASNENRKRLLCGIKGALEFINHIDGLEATRATTANAFVASFAKMYEERKELRDSVLVGLLKAMVVQLQQRQHNSVYLEKTLGFCTVLRSISSSAYRFFRSNIIAPSIRQIQRVESNTIRHCVIDLEDEALLSRLDQFLDHVHENGVTQGLLDVGEKVCFSIAIDGTKVPSRYEVSVVAQAVVGFVYPNHKLPVAHTNQEETIYDLATELKCAVVCLQQNIQGVSPIFVWAACPESDKVRYKLFNEKIASLAARTRNGILLSVATDGISTDSTFIQSNIKRYLLGTQSFAAIIDPNHDAKNVRNRILSGNALVCVGIGAFDPGLLVRAGVAKHLLEVHDWASDKAVLDLCSGETISKIIQVSTKLDTPNLLVTVSCLVFLRAFLFSVNANFGGAESERLQRAAMLYASLIWFTDIWGLHKTTVKNWICAVMPMCLLMLDENVRCPRYLTTEPAEHAFGILRSMEREFTIAGCIRLVSQLTSRLNNIFNHNLNIGSSNRGYQAGRSEFIRSRVSMPAQNQRDICSASKKRKYEENSQVQNTSKLVQKLARSVFASHGICLRMKKFCLAFQRKTQTRSVFLSTKFSNCEEYAELFYSSLLNTEYFLDAGKDMTLQEEGGSHQTRSIMTASSETQVRPGVTGNRIECLSSLKHLSEDLTAAIIAEEEGTQLFEDACLEIEKQFQEQAVPIDVEKKHLESFFTFLDVGGTDLNVVYHSDSKLTSFLESAVTFCSSARTPTESKRGASDLTQKFKTLSGRIRGSAPLPDSSAEAVKFSETEKDIGAFMSIDGEAYRLLCCFMRKGGRSVPCSLKTWQHEASAPTKSMKTLGKETESCGRAKRDKLRVLVQSVEKDELIGEFKLREFVPTRPSKKMHPCRLLEVDVEDFQWLER